MDISDWLNIVNRDVPATRKQTEYLKYFVVESEVMIHFKVTV